MTESDHFSSMADVRQMRLANPEVREALSAGRSEEAANSASFAASTALADLGAATLANGKLKEGLGLLQQAFDLQPANQQAFHNLVTALLARRLLRGPTFEKLAHWLIRNGRSTPWAAQYRRLLFMPLFLNLEFVLGKCNLKCRMCVGAQGDRSGRRLTCMSAEELRATLAAAPTISGLTLSSGDSEPLLHPEIEQVIDIAREHQVLIDIYTNGLALTSRICRKMVESGIVTMVNFSVDAATPETYRRIRGEDLPRLTKRIAMLRQIREETSARLPHISLSFVAMADNIEELPDFIRLARRLGASRVYVEDLIGWEDSNGPNQPATNHPRCFEYLEQAGRLAQEEGVQFKLPERLRLPSPPPAADAAPPPGSASTDQTGALGCCSWLNGIWIQRDGRMDPCCLIHDVADLGNVKDGPLLQNDKFSRVKDLLLAGKIFPECATQRMCVYVQQQLLAKTPLRFIPPEDLGERCAAPSACVAPGAAPAAPPPVEGPQLALVS